MEIKRISFFLILLLLAPSVHGLTATIDENIDIIAGDSKTINITFNAEKKTTISLNSNVLPSSEGFYITFSENDVTFKGNKIIQSTINTSPALMPDDYQIIIEYSYQEKETSKSGSGTVIISDDEKSDSSDEETEGGKNGEGNGGNEGEDEVEEDEEDDEQKEGEINGKNDDFIPVMIYFIPAVIILLLIILYFIIKRKKHQE